jgi:hypothetical protein
VLFVKVYFIKTYILDGVIAAIVDEYWRIDNSSIVLVECVNSKDKCNESAFGEKHCLQGYIGPLCETCDMMAIESPY